MNDQRFIELVNLYIDRHISAAETVELEGEIQSNPRRRALYKQYCQMHRATTLVYESFRAQVPEQPPAQPVAPGSIAQFETERRHRHHRWAYYASGLAAAACLGLVFVRLNDRPAAEINLLARAPVQTAPDVAAVASVDVSPGVRVAEPPAGLVSLRNNAAAEPDYAALLMALRQEEQRAFATGQIQPSRLPSLFEDGVFESQQVMSPANQRTFRGRQTPAQQAEFAAFQFQR